MSIGIINRILDLIYPRKCVFCGKVIDKGNICKSCSMLLPYTKGDGASQKLPFIAQCLSPLYYDDIVRDAFLRYKFNGVQSYAVCFGKIMAECVQNNLDCSAVDVISCVPLSKKRQRRRGYNQSELLAKEISSTVGVAMTELLQKNVDNTAQSKTNSSKQRLTNVSGVYSMKNGADVEGKTVLLVDDIVTTGATLSECARILRRAGAERVLAVTLARHRD